MLTCNHYKLLERCIEEGIAYGINRAFKHTDNPQHTQIEVEVYQAVLNEINDWFTIKGDGNE